ncbi:hypothetical protein I6A84_25445 [Frankia sp. CNm7]|uniref:SnoaL-like domain-containing protein n=1 Tax=Frankia nepalensis TaxID=1836974 RepID=A0A937UR38_9ACTN|nr:hypothetical protein [Frankia nepalensis]MBL7495244.1 hypothetical protein [Frankia nepalensis]MBL7516064.1 hypothetical protein [Frankia nepalensis]MBL7521338.1 hypothetical protein [Frankia nepalensis]MBL7632459.1 hypothetical protein [Frankia nepalensis]
MTTIDAGAMRGICLAAKVVAYDATVRGVVAAKDPGLTLAGWDLLAEFVAVDEFERVGTWLEVSNWQEYTEFLTKRVTSSAFDTKLLRISELPGVVYYEVEERHRRQDGTLDVVRSLSVFVFNEDGKICNLEVFLQKPPVTRGALLRADPRDRSRRRRPRRGTLRQGRGTVDL